MVWIVYTVVNPDSDPSKGGQSRSRDDKAPLTSVSTSSLRRERKVISPSLSDSRCLDKSGCDLWTTDQVRCGSVFVSPTDTVHHIKSSVLTTHISPNRKKKSSKHALAIGSSFGHVHAFLRDDNYVLQELERNRAKEQCLMLIKKPKSSSKQMLKSQSWTNLSVSDSHLYKQLDGGYNTNHRRNHKYRMKRKQSDLQPMPPESTDESESVDNISPRSSSNSDDGGFLRHREREKHWTDCRTEKSKSDVLPCKMSLCNSQKSESKSGEINNNKSLKNGGRLYRSQNDIYLEAPRLVEIDADDDDKCRIKSDEFYSPEKMPENNQKSDTENQDPMSRCHSLGDLTTGLTLSLVGQRKAESIQSLPLSVQPKPRLRYEKRKSEMSSNYSKKLSNQRDQQDAGQNQKQVLNKIQTKNFNGFNDCSTPKNSQNCDQIENSENYTQPKIYSENSHQGLENGFSVIQHQTLRTNAKNKTDILPDKTCGFNLIKSEKDDDDASDKSNQSSRSSDKTPVKTRRSLPMVPQGSEDLSEKKKRYTDIVKMRMSVQSCNSRNSNSRQSVMSSNSETPKLLQADETPSDREVSELLCHKNKNELNKSSSLNIGDCMEMTNGNITQEREHLLGNTNGNINTTLPSSVRSCDSGHTTVISLSSTMDSGYLTTDAENDMYSTSSYTRSLQRSAHSLYSASKLNNFTYGSMPRKDSLSVSRSKVNSTSTHSDNSENVHVKRIHSQNGDLHYSQVNKMLSADQGKVHDYDKMQDSGSGSVKNQEIIGSNLHSYNKRQESNSGNVKSPETMGHGATRIKGEEKTGDLYTQDVKQYQTQRNARCPPEGSAHPQPQINSSQYSQDLKEKLINRMREHALVTDNTANDYKSRSNVYNHSVQNNIVQNNMVQNIQETQNPIYTTANSFGFEGTSPPYRSSSGMSQSRGNMKSVRRDSMENLSKKDENFQVQNFTSSKGLSYSYTLPRASNSSYRGGNSTGNVNCSTQPVKNYNNCDERLPNFENTTFAPVARQQRAASEMRSLACPEQIYPVAGNIASSNFNTIPTSVSTKPTQLQYNGQTFVAKTVSHDYVNVQGHDMRSGLKVSNSVHQQFVNNQNMCSESRRGWKECDNFQSLSNPHNKITESWKPELSSGHPSENATLKTPSLCQLLQKYDFHLCQVKLGENSTVSDFIRLLESLVTLPVVKSTNEKKDSSAVCSPQGKCAQLGGPGSAFKPVKTVPSSMTNYTMTTVANIASHLPPACDLGGLQKGDIIIEVNEVLVMCKPLSMIKDILESQPGDMMLLVSRQKQEAEKEQLMKKNTEIDLLKNQLKKMNLELQKKNKAIQELSALLPWKQTGNKTKEINGNHLGNEFIVNGLSEDEFIV